MPKKRKSRLPEDYPVGSRSTCVPWQPADVLYFGCDMLEFLHDHDRLKFAFDDT